jgi:hypothetical protein
MAGISAIDVFGANLPFLIHCAFKSCMKKKKAFLIFFLAFSVVADCSTSSSFIFVELATITDAKDVAT